MPIANVLIGALIAFLVQSGSAAIGVILAMAGSGFIGFEQATAMALGEVIRNSGSFCDRCHRRNFDGKTDSIFLWGDFGCFCCLRPAVLSLLPATGFHGYSRVWGGDASHCGHVYFL